MHTLTATYCAFCDVVENFIKRLGLITSDYVKFDRECHKELSSLSDYQLKDIGLTRGDIMYVSRGGKVDIKDASL